MTARRAAATGVFSLLWLLVALPAASARRCCCSAAGAPTAWGHLLGCRDRRSPRSSRRGAVLRPASAEPDGRAADRPAPVLLDPGRPASTSTSACCSTRCRSCFVLLITGVGSLIHIYSIGYMAHDPDRRRFFAYLNLFVAAMLLLVLADNYLALYVGWEGVGLASYLLIGFWYHKPGGATAAKKAFIVNRVGDVGLSIAIMVMFATFGTVVDRRRVRAAALAGVQRHDDRDRAAAAARRLRQVGAGPAAVLAAATRWRARPRSPR